MLTYLNVSSSDIICDGADEIPQHVQKLPIKMHTNGINGSHFSCNVYVIGTVNELNPYGKKAKPYPAVISAHRKAIVSIIK